MRLGSSPAVKDGSTNDQGATTITVDDIRRAAAVLDGRVHRTPLLSSRALGEVVGGRALLKAELFQRTGSFKLRGALNRLLALTPDERRHGVITVSAGNHAQAVALAASSVGVDALVLMPTGASAVKARAAAGYGATVDLESSDAAEAFARMHAIGAETGRVVIHPFDDPLVVAGAGTVGLEIAEDADAVDVVVVPVGGGGLVSGIAVALDSISPGARVVAVQPEATGTLPASLAAGEPTRIDARPTVADALTPPSVGRLTLAICAALVDDVVLLTEEEIGEAVRFVYERTKLACEPGAAVAVGALLAGKVRCDAGENVVAVVSGGNVSAEAIARLLAP